MKRFLLCPFLVAGVALASTGVPSRGNLTPAMHRGEPQPGDDRGKDRKGGGQDDPKPHAKLDKGTLRGEPQPGDDRGRGRKGGGQDDPQPHS